MIKRTTIETIKEFDTEGFLIKETVIETKEEDDNTYLPDNPSYQSWNDLVYRPIFGKKWKTPISPSCVTSSNVQSGEVSK